MEFRKFQESCLQGEGERSQLRGGGGVHVRAQCARGGRGARIQAWVSCPAMPVGVEAGTGNGGREGGPRLNVQGWGACGVTEAERPGGESWAERGASMPLGLQGSAA